MTAFSDFTEIKQSNTPKATEKGAGAMGKKHTGDLRTALQQLLTVEHIEDGQTLTGAEKVALMLYDQATDPTSPHYTKAVDLLLKATDPRPQLAADEMRYKLTQATEPPTGFILDDPDPITERTRERIRTRTTSL